MSDHTPPRTLTSSEGAACVSAGARRISAIALLLAASILLSRVLGYVREAVLAWQLGATAEVDAYRAAFQIPDLLNYFLAGGALSIAFVPFYTRVRARQGPEAAEQLLAKILGTMTLVAIVATAFLWWTADTLIALQFPRFAPETQALTVRLTRIVLPAQIFFIAGGIIRAALMAHDRFATQALAPVVYNAAIIAGGAAFGSTLGAEGFAWGALLGAVIGPFLIPLLDAQFSARLRVRVRIALLDRQFWLILALPHRSCWGSHCSRSTSGTTAGSGSSCRGHGRSSRLCAPAHVAAGGCGRPGRGNRCPADACAALE